MDEVGGNSLPDLSRNWARETHRGGDDGKGEGVMGIGVRVRGVRLTMEVLCQKKVEDATTNGATARKELCVVLTETQVAVLVTKKLFRLQATTPRLLRNRS